MEYTLLLRCTYIWTVNYLVMITLTLIVLIGVSYNRLISIRLIKLADVIYIYYYYCFIYLLQVLLISECNLPFIPPAIWKLKKLRVLDISRNRINILVSIII